MKLLIPRSELKEAVTGLAKIVSAKASLPILSHIRLDADKKLRLTGTDLDSTASYTMEGHAPLPTPMSAIIPMEALQSLLKTTQGATIEIEKTDDNSVTIGCSVGGQAISRRVSMPDLDDWPNLPEPAKTKPVEPKLLEHIRQAIPFASTDDSRYVLKAVFLDVADKDCHKVVATDGRRLSAFNGVRLPLAESVILPTSKFLAWNKLTGEPSIGTDKANEVMTLNVGTWTYVTRLVSGTFPNYKQVIPGSEGLCLLELSKEDTELLVKALPSLPHHGNSDETVILRVEENAIRVYTREQGTSGESAIKLESSMFTGKPMSIGLNRHFLQDALRAGFCRFDLFDSISPIVGRLSKEDKHSVHVLMPMRTVDIEITPAQEPEAGQAAAHPPEVPVEPVTVQTINAKEKTMPKPEITPVPTTETSSLDRVLDAYEIAKTAVRQANTALSDVANAVREAIREDKARRKEVADVRAGLAKLQSIKV